MMMQSSNRPISANALNPWALAALAALLIAASLLPVRFLTNFSHDDAFFYLQVAKNTALGFGPTFDGFAYTNGFHPLWYMVVSMAYYPLGLLSVAEPNVYFRLAFGLHILLAAATIGMVFRLPSVRDSLESVWSRVLVAAGFVVLLFIRDVATEAALGCFLAAAMIWVKSREWQSGATFPVRKAVLYSALFLTRTDFLYTFIPMLILADVLTTRGTRQRLQTALYAAGGLILAAGLYYTWNLESFGHAFSVSARIKLAYPDVVFADNMMNLLAERKMVALRTGLSFLTSVIAGLVLLSPKRRSRMNIYLACALLGASGLLLLSLLYNYHGLRSWYTAVPVMLSVLWLSINVPAKLLSKPYVAIPGIAIMLAYFMVVRVLIVKWDVQHDFADAVDTVLPANARLLQIDHSGMVGFFSARHVVNGDGLINSFEYWNSLRRGEVLRYMEKYAIEYYATRTAAFDSSRSIYVDAPFDNIHGFERFAGLRLTFPQEQCVYQNTFDYTYPFERIGGTWSIFKIPPASRPLHALRYSR